jgi:hypothetical protein
MEVPLMSIWRALACALATTAALTAGLGQPTTATAAAAPATHGGSGDDGPAAVIAYDRTLPAPAAHHAPAARILDGLTGTNLPDTSRSPATLLADLPDHAAPDSGQRERLLLAG